MTDFFPLIIFDQKVAIIFFLVIVVLIEENMRVPALIVQKPVAFVTFPNLICLFIPFIPFIFTIQLLESKVFNTLLAVLFV